MMLERDKEMVTETAATARRKIPMTSAKKMLCAALGIGLIAACAIGLVFALTRKEEATESVLYSYDMTADASYRAHIIPNQLYTGEWLEEGLYYSSAITDYFELAFRAALQGSETATISGAYEVRSVLVGYQGSAETRETVYAKEYSLTSGTLDAVSGGGAAMEDVIQLSLTPYHQLSNDADAILGTSVSTDFSVVFSGVFYIETPYGTREQEFSYPISIPLTKTATLFPVMKPAEPVQASEQITETQTTTLPTAPSAVVLPAAGGIAGVLLLVFSFLFTRPLSDSERIERAHRNIVRKYGSRMIRLRELPDFRGKKKLYVADIESLLSLAEEIRQPVCYCPDLLGAAKDGLYFIAAPSGSYLYALSAPPTTLVVEPVAKGGR